MTCSSVLVVAILEADDYKPEVSNVGPRGQNKSTALQSKKKIRWHTFFSLDFSAERMNHNLREISTELDILIISLTVFLALFLTLFPIKMIFDDLPFTLIDEL